MAYGSLCAPLCLVKYDWNPWAPCLFTESYSFDTNLGYQAFFLSQFNDPLQGYLKRASPQV